MGEITLSAPTLLAATHELEDFRCGITSLDTWLARRARTNQLTGASRTYVVAAEQKIVGYYCLASGALAVNDAPSPLRRNMPDPIPMAIPTVVLSRLAVDETWHNRGLGVALLQDAVLRSTQAADILGIRGLMVHAISDTAKHFYEHHGFSAAPTQPMTLLLALKTTEKS